MSSAFVTYTLKIKDLADVGGQCKNFNIDWDDPSCGAINCYLTEDKDEVKVQVPEGCKECFKVYISCADDCINCEVEEKLICPCDVDVDCDGCSTCDQETNLCVSSCLDNEFCDDDLDICKECDENNPCPNGRDCINFKCECPPEKPYVNKDGDCIPCDPNNVPNCFICTKEGLIPKDCGDKICDPETDDCVCCLGSGDVGPNEKCVDKQCVCDDGYVRDVNGNCIPEPECEVDKDCPDCENCNRLGKCKPKVCPEGTVPVPDGEGGCDCKTPCDNGTDCGNGEGCDGEYCQECEDYPCDGPECDQLLGCGCDGDNNCVDIDSCGETPCDKPSDCKGENCTCHKGVCVDCANFDCTDCENIPGCDCIGSKGCVSVEEECEDTIEVVADDVECDLIGKLNLTTECSCTPITAVFKVNNPRNEQSNSLTADLVVELRKGVATGINQAMNLNRLDDSTKPNIADNDTPVSGSVSIEQVITLQEIDPVTRQVLPEDAIDHTVTTQVLSFNDDDGIKTLPAEKIYKEGADFTLSGDLYIIENVQLTVVQNNDLDFTGRSGCIYEASNTVANFEITESLFNEALSSGPSNLRKYKSLFSEDTRNPLLTWFRANPGASSYDMSSDFIRKSYDVGPATLFEDTLYGPDEIPEEVKQELEPSEGELYTGYKYAFKTDCTCDDDLFDFGAVGFCETDNINVDFNNCSKDFQILEFNVCDVNQDLDQFENAPANAQVYFELYIDGELEDTYQHRQTGGIKSNSSGKSLFRVITNDRSVGQITIIQKTSEYEVCRKTIVADSTDVPDVEINGPICGSGPNGSIEIPENNNGASVANVTSDNASVSFSSGVYTLTAPKGSTFQYTIFYANGCVVDGEITPDFCADCYGVSVSANAVSSGSPLIIDVVVTNGEPVYNYIVRRGGSVVKQGTLSSATDTITIDSASSGTYTVEVTDGLGCVASDTVQSNVIERPLILFDAPGFCEGDDAVFSITNIPSSAFGSVLNYSKTVNGATTSGLSVVLDQSIVTLDTIAPNTDVEYTLGELIQSGVEIEDFGGEVYVNTLIPEGEVNTFTPQATDVCLGSDVVIDVTGTPNSTVFLTNGDEISLDGNGEGQYVKSNLNVGEYNFVIDRVELSNDPGVCITQVSGQDATVVVSPGPSMITSSECESENENADRYLYFSVNENPNNPISQFTAEDIQNSSASLQVTYGGSDPNNSGYYRYLVTIPAGSSTTNVEGSYQNNAGSCSVSEVESTPDCSYPPATITLEDVVNGCINPSGGIVLDVNTVIVGGDLIDESQYQTTYYDGGDTIRAQSSTIHFTYNPGVAGTYNQLSVKVSIIAGDYEGLEQIVNFPTAIIDDVDFDIINMNGGSLPTTLCDNETIALGSNHTGVGSTYAWTIKKGNSAFDSSTDAEYILNPTDEGSYEIDLEITTADGCINEETIIINVESCLDCTGDPTTTENASVCDITAKITPQADYVVVPIADSVGMKVRADEVKIRDCDGSVIQTETNVLTNGPVFVLSNPRIVMETFSGTAQNGDTFEQITLAHDDGTGSVNAETFTLDSAVTLDSSDPVATESSLVSEINAAIDAVYPGMSSQMDLQVSWDTGSESLEISSRIIHSPSSDHVGVSFNTLNLGVTINGSSGAEIQAISSFTTISDFSYNNSRTPVTYSGSECPSLPNTEFNPSFNGGSQYLVQSVDFNEIVVQNATAQKVGTLNEQTQSCSSVIFEVTGTPCSDPIDSYSWYKNGTLLSGETSSTLDTKEYGYGPMDTIRVEIACGECTYEEIFNFGD